MTTTSRPVLVACAILEQQNKVLICKRPASANSFPDVWEFPGGKVEFGESPEEALRREMMEELSLAVDPVALSSVTSHVLPEKHIVLVAYRCRITDGEPVLNEHDDLRWVSVEELDEYELTPGTRGAALSYKH